LPASGRGSSSTGPPKARRCGHLVRSRTSTLPVLCAILRSGFVPVRAVLGLGKWRPWAARRSRPSAGVIDAVGSFLGGKSRRRWTSSSGDPRPLNAAFLGKPPCAAARGIGQFMPNSSTRSKTMPGGVFVSGIAQMPSKFRASHEPGCNDSRWSRRCRHRFGSRGLSPVRCGLHPRFADANRLRWSAALSAERRQAAKCRPSPFRAGAKPSCPDRNPEDGLRSAQPGSASNEHTLQGGCRIGQAFLRPHRSETGMGPTTSDY
jgi:hypothetical protein